MTLSPTTVVLLAGFASVFGGIVAGYLAGWYQGILPWQMREAEQTTTLQLIHRLTSEKARATDTGNGWEPVAVERIASIRTLSQEWGKS